MRRILVMAGVIVATLFLASATLVSASGALDESTSPVANAPGSHGDDDEGDGEGHGPPPDRGRPDGVGRSQQAGLLHSPGGPELPPQASPRAHEAVALAFERQQAIQERVALIRAMPGGPDQGPAVSELMKEFGQLYRLSGTGAEGGES